MNKIEKTYLHIDLDSFFASVEQRDFPEYRNKALIVGGLITDKRAVVSTASYEARKFGIHSAMPISTAYKLCPQGIFIRGRYNHYNEISNQIMKIFHNYSPDVIQMSIDEAFLDITGTEKIYDSPIVLAKKIKAEIFEKTQLTVSIGISRSMYIAKIASGYNKPNGLTFIPNGKEEEFMLSLPLSKIWGIGTKTQEHLNKIGLKDPKIIYGKSKELLINILGNSTGDFLYNALRGNLNYSFSKKAKNHSISSEKTFEIDLYDSYVIETQIMELAQNVLWRMHKENCKSKTVSLKIRYEDFTTVSIQETSDIAISNLDEFFEKCKKLFNKKYDYSKGIRLLGVSCENLESKTIPTQKLLFNDINEKKSKLEKTIFEMEQKNPKLKITKARLILKEQNTHFHPDQND